LEVTQDGTVRIITMARPQVRNAMDTALLAALLDAVAVAVADNGTRVVLLAGAGGAFSAGADLREELDHAGAVRRMDLFCQVYEAIGTCRKPTVSAISGACVGGGAEVAAACDIRVCDPSARFRFPGAALGIPVGAAKLVGLVGLGSAKDLVLSSRTIDADEALRIGFVQAVADDALVAGRERAAAIAGNDPDTVDYLKRQFATFSGLGDRIAAENDALHGHAETGGDWAALTMADPKKSGGWAGATWTVRQAPDLSEHST
jgi:enoyl-CoA hydratase/carnithine racemase